jgi:hypothetical protein
VQQDKQQEPHPEKRPHKLPLGNHNQPLWNLEKSTA